jgi:hypothetical protein
VPGPVILTSATPIAGNRTGRQLDTGDTGTAGILIAYGGYQAVDATHNARLRFEIPPQVIVIRRVRVSFSLQPFRSGQQSTAQSATTSGGSPHDHETFHSAGVTIQPPNTGVGQERAMTARDNLGNVITVNLDSQSGITGFGGGADGTIHTYTSDSTHSHTVPGQTLNPPTGLYETGNAAGAHILVDGFDVNSQVGAPGGGYGTGVAIDISDIDITKFIRTLGWHEVQITSSAIGGVIPQCLSVCTIAGT